MQSSDTIRKLTIYREDDTTITSIQRLTVAFLGYGNQGRSQALNMRDHGIHVIIGNRPDSYRERAIQDGFEAYTISEAVQKAQVFFMLMPDEIQLEVYTTQIAPFLKPHDILVFAHGYNICFNLIRPPPFVDVLIVAPRMIGVGVRECFLNREGYFSFIGIGQDASGQAHAHLLSLTKGVGGASKGAIESNFFEETVLDLFTEQGFGPASSQMMMKPKDILLEKGIPAEAILIEMILSGKMKYSFNNMLQYGIIDQLNLVSPRSQYGILSRGMRYQHIIQQIGQIQRNILHNIESGAFAREWERKLTKWKFRLIKFFSTRIGFAVMERKGRVALALPEGDLWAEAPYPTPEEIDARKRLKTELAEFTQFPEF